MTLGSFRMETSLVYIRNPPSPLLAACDELSRVGEDRGEKELDHRFLFIISIGQVCVTDDDLIHFVFPLEDHRHLINLGDVLKDPLLQFRFRIDPNIP
jgi:hypothetical protein